MVNITRMCGIVSPQIIVVVMRLILMPNICMLIFQAVVALMSLIRWEISIRHFWKQWYKEILISCCTLGP